MTHSSFTPRIAALFLLLLSSSLYAQTGAPGCAPALSTYQLSINKVNAQLIGAGGLFYSYSEDTSLYEVPKGTGKNPLYSAGLWIGGKTAGGVLKTAAQSYGIGQDFWAGPIDIDGKVNAQQCQDYDRHYYVSKAEIDQFKKDGTVTDNIKNWPGNRSNNTPLAPYVDVDSDGIYNPSKGDYPQIKGDGMTWWVYNDIGNVHSHYPSPQQIGIEIQESAYAFKTPYIGLDQATFHHFKLRYTGVSVLDSTYIGLFVDPDLGNFNDDYIGCSPKRNIGYVYNGDDDDEGERGYGRVTPAIGLRILEGIEDQNRTNVRLSKFMYFTERTNSSQADPVTFQGVYNYLKAVWNDNTPLTYGGSGYKVTSTDKADFAFPGKDDPQDRAEWTEAIAQNPSGDRRIVLSMGPVTLQPGATLDFTIGIPFVQAGTSKQSLDSLLKISDEQQLFFDSGCDTNKIGTIVYLDKPTDIGLEGEKKIIKVRLSKVPTEDIVLKFIPNTRKKTSEGDIIFKNTSLTFKSGESPVKEIEIEPATGKITSFDTLFYYQLVLQNTPTNVSVSQGELAYQVLKRASSIQSINGTNTDGTAVKEGSNVIVSGLVYGSFDRKTSNLTIADSSGGIALVTKTNYKVADLFSGEPYTQVWACGTITQANCLNVINITKFVELPKSKTGKKARAITKLTDNDESDFVVFKNCSVVDSMEWKSIQNGALAAFATRFTNGKDTVLVKFEGGTNGIPTPKKVDVYGVGYQFSDKSQASRNRMIRVPNKSYIVPNGTSGIQENRNLTTTETIAIFPNPATDQLNIVCEHNTIQSVSIFSIEGKKVWERTQVKSNMLKIDAHQELRSGLYLVLINTIDNKQVVKKVIID